MNKCFKILFIICVIFFISDFLSGQTITWQKTFGDDGEDVGYSIIQTFIGDYIMCGYNQTFSTRIIKVNHFGNVIWNKIYSGNSYDKIIQTYDSNFILVGSAIGINGIGTDGYFIKIDNIGNILWWKKYGGPNSDFFHDVIETKSGELIIIGTYTENAVLQNGNGQFFRNKKNDIIKITSLKASKI